MDNQPQSIFTLINQMREQGLTEQDIRSRLLLSGWAWPTIDQAFTQLASQTKRGKQPTTVPAPSPSTRPPAPAGRPAQTSQPAQSVPFPSAKPTPSPSAVPQP